jgi:mRNA-degrading endonuclease toxin of MazEF toxin-antitoxin module
MTRRGDVVIARFPYAGGTGFKVRPAVVVQCDSLNRRLHNTIVAMVTSNTNLIGVEPTQLLIDPATPEGAASGLSYPSAVKCENLATIPQADIVNPIGQLSIPLQQRLNDCLKITLEIP